MLNILISHKRIKPLLLGHAVWFLALPRPSEMW